MISEQALKKILDNLNAEQNRENTPAFRAGFRYALARFEEEVAKKTVMPSEMCETCNYPRLRPDLIK